MDLIVYRIHNDVDHFNIFFTNKPDDLLKLSFDCSRKEKQWSPPSVNIYKPLHQEGDFFQFDSSSLIFHEKKLKEMYRFFVPPGELLPLPFLDELFYVLNVTNCINCLDQNETKWETAPDGTKLHITNFHFHSNRFSEAEIFKVPEARSDVLVVVDRPPRLMSLFQRITNLD